MTSPEHEAEHEAPQGRIVNVRKLVALDIVAHGPRFIFIECVFTITLGLALGLWILLHALSSTPSLTLAPAVISGYFFAVAVNYVPLLLYAIVISRRKSARDEIAAELAQRGNFALRYGLQQLLLFLPLVIPILAIAQEARGRRHARR